MKAQYTFMNRFTSFIKQNFKINIKLLLIYDNVSFTVQIVSIIYRMDKPKWLSWINPFAFFLYSFLVAFKMGNSKCQKHRSDVKLDNVGETQFVRAQEIKWS